MAEFPTSTFEKGVVTAVYVGPASLGEIAAQLSAARIDYVPERLPRNSVVVRRISGGLDKVADSYALCYPFFSSHISMPVKPAETVWIIFDRAQKNIGYWLSRVHGDETAEDVNYSHYDRMFSDSKIEMTTAEKAGVISDITDVDDFPNVSLQENRAGNSYDLILDTASYSYANIRLEPVPRYSKSPGDLVFQGSNNATIALTTDRGWSPSQDPQEFADSNATHAPQFFSGAVDTVVGRSRWMLTNEVDRRTTPTTRVNRRSFREVSKRISDDLILLPTEGDPDFLDDSARLYIAMNSKIDYNFGLLELTPSLFANGEPPPNVIGSSAVMKADEIRIIARTDVDHAISGSIRIIKEGVKDDDLSAIIMQPDGLLQISAREIHLGRSSADGGLEEGDSDAPGTSQPYVKYKQLEDLLKAVMTDIKSFCDTVSTHTTPGYGAPSPQLNSAASTLKSAMDSRKEEIKNIKSVRIFGE